MMHNKGLTPPQPEGLTPPREVAICVHGHFYQPPRENPWTGAVDPQQDAHPYPDWNRKITAECYANIASGALSRMSFNFGPTLLSWLEKHEPQVHAAILAADSVSRARFSGHGSAIAQAYNHVILPLASARDKETQVLWGVRDFARRFGRAPEGLWLPETAVDVATLEVLARFGIRFTILAPSQARAVRPIGAEQWEVVSGEQLDTRMPYRLLLPSGREITLFFFDGAASHAVAFAPGLDSGDALARLLESRLDPALGSPQLVHIATDGETYGHHHRERHIALARALDAIEARGVARLTNYAEFLERNPPVREVQILENTSWSCEHGLLRWSDVCGCRAGTPSPEPQLWRAPLRRALDWLRDGVAPLYEERAGEYFTDPWEARNGWIEVILDHSPESVWGFFERHARRILSPAETKDAIDLLELQRRAMLMYTSCGWFFDDPASRLETRQILHEARRVMELSEGLFGVTLEPSFLDLLEGPAANLRVLAR
jgi:alpha-amylase/alpha-mannosidase (GH57 family)